MNERTLSIALISGVLIAVLSGLACLFSGHRNSRYARPFLGVGLLGLLVPFVLGWVYLVENGSQITHWSVGWVVSVPEIAKIRVGIIHDPAGFLMASIAIAVCLLVLFVSESGAGRFRDDRTAAGLSFSTAGIALSWISASPWLVFAGMILAIGGGFISLTDSLRGDAESKPKDPAESAPRFLLEKSLGFLLCLLGALMLNGSGLDAAWPVSEAWESGGTVRVATSLFCLGALLQFGVFPLNASGMLTQAWFVPARLFSAQLAPAWCAFVFLIRLRQQLVETDVLPVLGWFALGASILSTVSGLFQPSWRRTLAVAVSVSFCLSAGALAFSSRVAALGLLIGFSLAAFAMSAAAQLCSEGPGLETARRKKLRLDGPSAALFGGTLAFSGFLGFVASTGFVRWLQMTVENPLMASLECLAIFLFMLLAWKAHWLVLAVKSAAKPSWRGLLAAGLAAAAGLAVIWSGEATGLGLLPVATGESGSFLVKAVETSFVVQSHFNDWMEPRAIGWIYVALLLIAVLAGYTAQNVWSKLTRGIPRAAQFMAGGYGVAAFGDALISRLRRASGGLEEFAAQRFWLRWLSHALSVAMRGGSRAVYLADVWVFRRAAKVFGRSLDFSVSIPRTIQNGDVQWYLLFATVCTILILLNFMKD